MGPGCDIYALGVILYQLLTGRLPFEGSVAEVLGQIVTQQPPPPSQHRPGLDPRLEAICLKALSKKVAGRYASMRDLGAALGDYLRRDAAPAAVLVDQSLAAPELAADRSSRPRTPWLGRRMFWLCLAAGILATAGAAAAFLPRRGAPQNTESQGTESKDTDSRGTIRIELDRQRARVEVRVNGQRIDRTSLNEPLRLLPGRHHLLVTGKKIRRVDTYFSVTPGDNPALRVHLVPRDDDDDDHDKRERHFEPYDD
jgi:serine/threonine protein kinase